MSAYARRFCIHDPETRHNHYTDNFQEMLTALDQGKSVSEGCEDHSDSGDYVFRRTFRELTKLRINGGAQFV